MRKTLKKFVESVKNGVKTVAINFFLIYYKDNQIYNRRDLAIWYRKEEKLLFSERAT